MSELKNKMIARIKIFWWMSIMRIKFWALSRRVNEHVKKSQEIITKHNEELNRNRLIWAYEGCLGENGEGIRDLSYAVMIIPACLIAGGDRQGKARND